MTPEEKAVIQAAIEWRRAIPGRHRDLQLTIKLEDKIWELITRCDKCNYGRHLCPGDGNPIGHGDNDCGDHDDDGPVHDPLSGELIPAGQAEELERMGREIAEDPPQWYARTMSDVRPGDTIRPLGITGPESHVTARCWPPTKDTRGRGSWHVIEGSDGHWSDHVVQPGECCVHLDGAGHRLFRPTFGVEILLSPSGVQAIELLGGWDNRERMITE